jgi:uncharacterized Zn finger protein
MWRRDYTSIREERKREADRRAAIAKLKKNSNFHPIVATSRKLATTWWGLAWNNNLESYAGYANRLGRGRTYVRNGSVLDLQIEVGVINALVTGRMVEPYKIKITIDELPREKWQKIVDSCGRSIENLEQLAAGQFPQELEHLFTQKGEGLFPSPKEIHFSCSCPDWAAMCKHVAAALYGVGVRLDEDINLFFKLRNIEIDSLIKKSIEDKMQNMLKNTGKKTKRTMENADIKGLFGI